MENFLKVVLVVTGPNCRIVARSRFKAIDILNRFSTAQTCEGPLTRVKQATVAVAHFRTARKEGKLRQACRRHSRENIYLTNLSVTIDNRGDARVG